MSSGDLGDQTPDFTIGRPFLEVTEKATSISKTCSIKGVSHPYTGPGVLCVPGQSW